MKGQFGSTLTFLVSMLFAVLALILVWSVMSKIFGFSTDILLGAADKFACQAGKGTATVGVGGGGAVVGCGAGAAIGVGFGIVGAAPGCLIGGLIGGVGGALGTQAFLCK